VGGRKTIQDKAYLCNKKLFQVFRLFYYLGVLTFYGRVPCACASGSGYTLQVLVRFAHCGLFATIPHAKAR